MIARTSIVAVRGAGLAFLLLLLARSFMLPGPTAQSVAVVLGLFALSWISPASGLILFAGLAPLSTFLSELLESARPASQFLEQLALAVSAGVSARYLRKEGQSGLTAPVFLVATIAAASALSLLPAQVAAVTTDADRFRFVFDAWAHGRTIVSPRLFLPLQYAVVAIECAFLAWSAERVIRGNPKMAGHLVLMGLVAHAAAGMLNVQRLAVAAMSTRDFIGSFAARLMDTRVSMQTDVNAAGSLLVLGGVAGLGVLGGSVRRRLGVVLLECCVLAGLWVTGSRSAMLFTLIGWLLGSAWIAVRLKGTPRRIAGLVAAGLVIAVVAGALAYPAGRNDRVQGSLEGRLALARAGWQMFETAPVFGVGVTQFYERSPEFVGPDTKRLTGQSRENAHNNFVQILAEQGSVGLLATGMALTMLLAAAMRADRAAPSTARLWLAVGIIAAMGTWLTGHPLLVPEFALVFWFYCGALAGTTSGVRPGRWFALAAACAVIVLATVPSRASAARDAIGMEHGAINLSLWQHDDAQRYREGGARFTLFLPGWAPVKVPIRRAPGSPDPLHVELRVRGTTVNRVVLTGDAWHDLIVTLPKRDRLYEEVDVRVEAATGAGSPPAVLVRVGRDSLP